MSQPTEIVLPTLTRRDRVLIEALEADFRDGGQGISQASMESLAGTTYLKRVIRRMRAAGIKVVSSGSTPETTTFELTELPHNPSAPDDGRSISSTPGADDRSSGADEEGELLLFDPPAVSHHRQDVEGRDFGRRSETT
jgi:hypothetical protein